MESGRHVLDLLHELDMYRSRYRNVDVPEQVESINLSISRRARRVEVVRRQVTELIDEMTRLEEEVEGLQKGYEALLMDALDRIRREHDEGWSPTPVIGYRLWEWRDDGLHGAWEQWSSSVKEATCRHPGDVPHSNGKCGRLGCGVYAAKGLDPLLAPRITPGTTGYAAGVVELTGKVVEHDLGYRSERAEVVELILVGAEGLCQVADPKAIILAFADPDQAYAKGPHLEPDTEPASQMQELFDRRHPIWTSEPRSV